MIPLETAADVLRRVAQGKEVAALARPGQTWQKVYCGDFEFTTRSGWTFAIFNDCDELDYASWATDPSGQTTTFREWADAYDGDDPVNALTLEEQDRLGDVLDLLK